MVAPTTAPRALAALKLSSIGNSKDAVAPIAEALIAAIVALSEENTTCKSLPTWLVSLRTIGPTASSESIATKSLRFN